MKPRSPFTLLNKPIVKTPWVKPTTTKLKILRLAIQAYRQMDIKKLWSRKLLIVVASAVLFPLWQQFGMFDQTMQAIMVIVSCYLLGQSWADGKAAEAEGKIRTSELETKMEVDMARLNTARDPWKAEGETQATSLNPLTQGSMLETNWNKLQRERAEEPRSELAFQNKIEAQSHAFRAMVDKCTEMKNALKTDELKASMKPSVPTTAERKRADII